MTSENYWNEGIVGEYRYVQRDGLIVGRVKWLRMESSAEFKGRDLGRFVTSDDAKRAVEKAFADDVWVAKGL